MPRIGPRRLTGSGPARHHAADSVVRGMETTKTRYDYGAVRT